MIDLRDPSLWVTKQYSASGVVNDGPTLVKSIVPLVSGTTQRQIALIDGLDDSVTATVAIYGSTYSSPPVIFDVPIVFNERLYLYISGGVTYVTLQYMGIPGDQHEFRS